MPHDRSAAARKGYQRRDNKHFRHGKQLERKAMNDTEYQGFLTMSRSFGSWEGIRCSDSR